MQEETVRVEKRGAEWVVVIEEHSGARSESTFQIEQHALSRAAGQRQRLRHEGEHDGSADGIHVA